MRTFKILTISLFAILITSCGSTITFPVSDKVPAAHITAKEKTDKNGNTELEITAKHLANPQRLSPSKKLYVVWIVTENDLVKNVGQLQQEGRKAVDLTIVTSFNIKEIFITAEDEGNVVSPGKTMITSKKI